MPEVLFLLTWLRQHLPREAPEVSLRPVWLGAHLPQHCPPAPAMMTACTPRSRAVWGLALTHSGSSLSKSFPLLLLLLYFWRFWFGLVLWLFGGIKESGKWKHNWTTWYYIFLKKEILKPNSNSRNSSFLCLLKRLWSLLWSLPAGLSAGPHTRLVQASGRDTTRPWLCSPFPELPSQWLVL